MNYTDPVMRDETYRRWKGGSKLSDDLRNFYTNPRVWARLGEANPMGPKLPPKAEALKNSVRFRANLGGSWKQNRGRDTMGPANRMDMLRSMFSPKSAEEERAAARQSGATL